MTRHGEEYDLFTDCIDAGRFDNVAPGDRFGYYLHPTLNQKQLRESQEGRVHLLSQPVTTRGRSHEKESDIAPFVAWDGEGITYEQGLPQEYVLFGSSTGHMVQGRNLPTAVCLDTILDCERDNPAAIHVGFAFKYDAEMILKDLSTKHWYVLRKNGSVNWEHYTITYHPGRLLRISQTVNKQRTTATLYDVWGMFQSSFVKALRGWLDTSELSSIDKIEEGKALRGAFTDNQIDSLIRPYWEEELRLLVVLCDRLRERLNAVDLCPREWHGAGAVASTVYRSKGTRKHQSRTDRDRHPSKDKDLTTNLPKEVNEAARFAYAGGRFELFGIGHTNSPVYQYDINSAYPNAISHLPSLRDAEWEHQVSPTFDSRLFGVWRVEYANWENESLYTPGPLFHRDYEGRVSFPANTTGWYWTPEAAIAAANSHARITDAWILHSNGDRPFEWVRELYDERKARKRAGDPSEKALKLALNSLYGKMAQRLGYREGDALPRFHQLEWAGWVTSYTRAMLYRAMVEAGSDLVSVETDAVFSLRPLSSITIGPDIGQWECTEHAWLTYLQSGTYWSDHGAKYRGFDRDSLSHDDAMRWLSRGNWSDPLVGTTTRFVGSGTGLGSPLHRCWVTDSRDMQPGKSGKRVHVPETCLSCASGVLPTESFHPLICIARGGTSFPHSLPWIADGAPGLEWQELQDAEQWSMWD